MAERGSTTTSRQKLRPRDVAALWGISQDLVIGWIRAGELPAINAASSRTAKKPRYLIDRVDLDRFERARAVTPPAAPAPRHRRTPENKPAMEYF